MEKENNAMLPTQEASGAVTALGEDGSASAKTHEDCGTAEPADSSSAPQLTQTAAAPQNSEVGMTPQSNEAGETSVVSAAGADCKEQIGESAAGNVKIPPHEIYRADSDPPRRGKLVFMLICTLLAAVAVIIYGTSVAASIGKLKTPLNERFLTEVFGRGITSIRGGYVHPPLLRIPYKPVVEGEEAGAAEEETVSESAPEALPESGTPLPVRDVDLSVKPDNVFSIINETPYEPDVISLYAEESEIPPLSELQKTYGEGAPIVLIMHTHGTESYLSGGADSYDSAESFRSHNADESVVTVGRVAAARLRERGIGVIHLETMFDAEDYNSAYILAAEEIRRITEEYPSVSYVFDIHRDAMITSQGVNLRPTSPQTWNGGAASQIMLVVGTDHAGSGHTEWEDNLSVALKLQKKALSLNGGIMRAINLRSASFNEQYTKGSLLVEIGACGGSLTEACRAAEIFAEAAAQVIKGE